MIQLFEFVEFRGIGDGYRSNFVRHRNRMRQVLHRFAARELLQGVGFGKLRRRTFGDDFTAELARGRAHVDKVVGGLHHLHVVFHHHERVAEVAQAVERVEKHGGVAFVEAHRGFVEHVKPTFEAAADLACETDALRFAAAERVARAVETDVA